MLDIAFGDVVNSLHIHCVQILDVDDFIFLLKLFHLFLAAQIDFFIGKITLFFDHDIFDLNLIAFTLLRLDALSIPRMSVDIVVIQTLQFFNVTKIYFFNYQIERALKLEVQTFGFRNEIARLRVEVILYEVLAGATYYMT